MYVETVLAREDHAKEVKLFGLGPRFLRRYTAIFEKLYAGDRTLTIRRGSGRSSSALLSTASLYGMYVWIAVDAVAA